jgi:hypothetical protein
MIPIHREILGIARRHSRDILTQCLVCGSLSWSDEFQERAECRCYSQWHATPKSMPEIRLLSDVRA